MAYIRTYGSMYTARRNADDGYKNRAHHKSQIANSLNFLVRACVQDGPTAIDWSRYPPYLVGVPAFDQAVIGRAVAAGIAVVDVTETLHAFHQSGVSNTHNTP